MKRVSADEAVKLIRSEDTAMIGRLPIERQAEELVQFFGTGVL